MKSIHGHTIEELAAIAKLAKQPIRLLDGMIVHPAIVHGVTNDDFVDPDANPHPGPGNINGATGLPTGKPAAQAPGSGAAPTPQASAAKAAPDPRGNPVAAIFAALYDIDARLTKLEGGAPNTQGGGGNLPATDDNSGAEVSPTKLPRPVSDDGSIAPLGCDPVSVPGRGPSAASGPSGSPPGLYGDLGKIEVPSLNAPDPLDASSRPQTITFNDALIRARKLLNRPGNYTSRPDARLIDREAKRLVDREAEFAYNRARLGTERK